VEPASVAERIGIEAGDTILELNGRPLVDPVDFQFKSAMIGRRMTIRTQKGSRTFVRREWESFGVEFEPIEPLTCQNNCVFCFVHQNPAGVRPSLHIKDEDYRLSFLFGNYLTLTNVGEAELQRIIDQRLSPLYISVHATEPSLRARMLGNSEYDGFLEKVERLVEAGITVHGQVVLCPEWNDGEHLERTVSDLVQLHPGVGSLAVVPVGLTKHRKNLPDLKPFTPEVARQTIEHVSSIQKKLKRRLGTPFVFIGDEIYIMANQPLPPVSHYRDFPQIENGVGMVRTFIRQFDDAVRRRSKAGELSGTVCTGKVFEPYLRERVNKLGMDLKVVGVESLFWGPGIGVAGLLTGSDFISALRGKVHGNFVVLPSESMIGDDFLFLDDLTLKDVQKELGVKVIPSGYTAGEFVESMRNLAGKGDGLLNSRIRNVPVWMTRFQLPPSIDTYFLHRVSLPGVRARSQFAERVL
jgi:putative radical SAM enzyme (TIGR03279 family)